jgi:hypothetical protein
MSNYYRSILNVQAAIPLDPDAEAFLLAAGITDATITSAINDLVISLKADGIWSKMIAIYPLVGGTASTHKFNLKNPADSDAAFRLTFVGSPTHSANGIQGNGTSQYANTHLNPSSVLSLNNASSFFYTNLNSGTGVDFGAFNGGTNTGFQVNKNNASSLFVTRANQGSANTIAGNTNNGFFGISRTNSSNYVINQEGSLQTVNLSSVALVNLNIFLTALNVAGSPDFYSARRYAFYCFGEGLDSTEQGNLKTAVDTFQTALSRA